MICGDDWIEIERRVRAGESARAISRDLTSTGHKISHTAINKHCRRGGWKLPDSEGGALAQAIGVSRPQLANVEQGRFGLGEEAGQKLSALMKGRK